MKLCAGERVAWPITNFSTSQEHLLGAINGVPFIRIKANLILPGLPAGSIQTLKLELIATQDNDYREEDTSSAVEGTQWLNHEIHSRLNRTTNLAIASSKDDICDLLGELLKLERSRKQRRIDNHRSLGNQAELTLFNTLECNERISEKSQRKTNTSVTTSITR